MKKVGRNNTEMCEYQYKSAKKARKIAEKEQQHYVKK